jgi:hypothetical protein
VIRVDALDRLHPLDHGGPVGADDDRGKYSRPEFGGVDLQPVGNRPGQGPLGSVRGLQAFAVTRSATKDGEGGIRTLDGV